MPWTSLQAGGTRLFLAYGRRYTHRVFGYGARVRQASAPELAFDLNPNLRTWNILRRGFLAARDLARGGIGDLKLLQVADSELMSGLEAFLAAAGGAPAAWTLTLELKGRHAFRVFPQWGASPDSLSLHVISKHEAAPEAP